ncbi:hypothetical protein EDD22DRAFT_1018026 [Suillus occidentalis]|nr:hypothetical protein EDD22DRAFT_1018026 [Suillus occidentalis]
MVSEVSNQNRDTTVGGTMDATLREDSSLETRKDHLLLKPGLAPVLLSTIYRRWREAAVGFPNLWCTLQLQVDDADWQQRVLCYDSWLKRSRGCPLLLRIVCHGDLSELRNALQPYIQQISSPTLDFFLCDKPLMVDDFHALKELTILERGVDFARAIDQSLSKLLVNLHRLDMTQLVPDSAWARLTYQDQGS